MHISLIQKNAFDVSPVQEELKHIRWNDITLRTADRQSPHREVDDIWVRYNPIENYQGDMRRFNEAHVPEWYPIVEKLPSVKALAIQVYERMQGRELGAVLITRIPSGKQVYPHVDIGWHARRFEKYCVQIHGNLHQAFHFEGEELRTEAGDLFWFDNAVSHWVTNVSPVDRVSLIICVRS